MQRPQMEALTTLLPFLHFETLLSVSLMSRSSWKLIQPTIKYIRQLQEVYQSNTDIVELPDSVASCEAVSSNRNQSNQLLVSAAAQGNLSLVHYAINHGAHDVFRAMTEAYYRGQHDVVDDLSRRLEWSGTPGYDWVPIFIRKWHTRVPLQKEQCQHCGLPFYEGWEKALRRWLASPETPEPFCANCTFGCACPQCSARLEHQSSICWPLCHFCGVKLGLLADGPPDDWSIDEHSFTIGETQDMMCEFCILVHRDICCDCLILAANDGPFCILCNQPRRERRWPLK